MDPRSSQDAAKAEHLLNSGNLAGALTLFERLAKKSPKDAALQYNVGVAKGRLGDHKGAIRALQKAISLKPSVPMYHVDLGQILLVEGRYEDAERTFDKALRLDPNMPFAIGAKIEFLQLVGRFEEATELTEAGLAKHPRDIRLAVAYARLAPRIKAETRAIDTLQKILDDPEVNRQWNAGQRQGWENPAKTFVLFRQANLLDRVGDYDRAFKAAQQANNLINARFNPAVYRESVDRMIEAWTPDAIERLPRATRAAEQNILIVGMMRSGTSLVEQILSCHPDVFGAGEVNTIANICAQLKGPCHTHEPHFDDLASLTTQKLDQAQRKYILSLYNLGARSEKRVTDKMPSNFLHLGFASRMLPGVRVVHCMRNPLDTAVSCFLQQFHSIHPWCYRLEWIGAYLNQYKKIIDHWSSVLTDVPILHIAYEDLVNDPDTWIPRLIEFAGLEWDDACMRFHESKRVTRTVSNEQVRQPLYKKSVARHKNYADHLNPLREALEATQ